MLISMNWLKDYLTKSDVKIDPRELAEKLTMRGLSVAKASPGGQMGLNNVVVGKIEKIEKHPNADRLSVTQVTIGEPEPRPIVCGAKNISVGDIVPVALPGAMLPDNLTIEISTIRGVESFGMLCSGQELGLSSDSEGILQLPKHSQVGQSLARLLGQQSDDLLLELELTPNRGDCLSIMGIAREMAPILDCKLRELKPAKFRSTAHRTSSIISVEIPDPNLCPRYVARVIDGFKVLEAPDWIQARLQSIGQKCVNNIVDIANFVMFEYGAPLHAFDLRKIQSGIIRVAACREPSDFTLLTGQVVRVEPGDILILDGDRPIALAGIMGGQNSQIEHDSTSILLEAATFNPQQIRRTAKRLALLTEASRRFEKGVDANTVGLASERAAVLIRDAYSANVYHPPIDTLENAESSRLVAVDMREVRRTLGIPAFTAEQAAELLGEIAIEANKKSINILQVRVPGFRQDLRESIDIIEEIARLYGYDRIPLNLPLTTAAFGRSDESLFDFSRHAKLALKAMGLRETIHYSFVSEAMLRDYARTPTSCIRISNPISDQMCVMRTSLLPSLIQTYIYNKNRQRPSQRLFEVATSYEPVLQSETGAKERLLAAALISGSLSETQWRVEHEPTDYFIAKGAAERFIRDISSADLTFSKATPHPAFHPNRSAEIYIGAQSLGIVGELHPHCLQTLEATGSVVAFEVDLEVLYRYNRSGDRYQPPSKFPSVDYDIALLVDKSISAQTLKEAIRESGSLLLASANVFDVYEGEKIPIGKRSIGFRLRFSNRERTLQEREIAPLVDRIVQSLKEKYAATLRA